MTADLLPGERTRDQIDQDEQDEVSQTMLREASGAVISQTLAVILSSSPLLR